MAKDKKMPKKKATPKTKKLPPQKMSKGGCAQYM